MKLLFALLTTAVFTGSAQAQASFDCSLAATDVEKAICADATLAALDRQMADAYRSARTGQPTGRRDRILEEQRLWLARRNACGGTRSCLADAMRTRIAQLSFAPADGLTGLYCADRRVMSVEEIGETLRFDFMFFSGDHACATPVLEAVKTGTRWIASNADCRLVLTLEGSDIIVRSESPAACKAAYCGARAQIGEFRMPLSARVPEVRQPFVGGIGERPC